MTGFKFFKDLDDIEVTMEAGRFWEPVYDLLVDKGYKVKLAHPLKTRIIADTKIRRTHQILKRWHSSLNLTGYQLRMCPLAKSGNSVSWSDCIRI